jgi:hypothetical protein
MSMQEAELREQFSVVVQRSWAPIEIREGRYYPVSRAGCDDMDRLLAQASSVPISDSDFRGHLEWAAQAIKASRGREYTGGYIRATIGGLWLIALIAIVVFELLPPLLAGFYSAATILLVVQAIAYPLFFITERTPRLRLNEIRRKGREPSKHGADIANVSYDFFNGIRLVNGCLGCLFAPLLGISYVLLNSTVLFPVFVIVGLTLNYFIYRSA